MLAPQASLLVGLAAVLCQTTSHRAQEIPYLYSVPHLPVSSELGLGEKHYPTESTHRTSHASGVKLQLKKLRLAFA